MKKTDKDSKSNLTYGLADGEQQALIKVEEPVENSLIKSILNVLNGAGSVERLAFETDPGQINKYMALYRAKMRLIPDSVLKRISIQDDLVATIVRGRQNQISVFGRPRPDRFSNGFIIEPNPGVLNDLDINERKELGEKIKNTIRKIWHCGSEDGWDDKDRMTFSQMLTLATRSAVVVGRVAIERIFVVDPTSGAKKFHSFRPIDAGTIYKATSQKEAAQTVREQAVHLLQQYTSHKLRPEKFQNDEYRWVQVIEGRPYQAFTGDECVVCNFYPVPDVELDGYPVTPIDTAISAITTHINITTHNKLYFQNGRAAKGMLVIKSDDADPQVVHNIKQFFNASINSVNSAWRMPVFGCGSQEDIGWQSLETSTRDMEFQYLTDMNARIIMSAFMISPDELPGWTYLSRGTNNQALSEGNNEYKLEAARDLGIRPLLTAFEDFFNTEIYPWIDPELSKITRLRFVGLDADNAEKEAVRLQQDMAIHLTYDEVLERVEKRPIGRKLGGMLPLNAVYTAYLDKYFTVGEILEEFCGIKGASQDPGLAYRRDPFWFQWVQLQQQMQMAQQQAQMQQQQAAQGGGGQGGGGQEGGGQGGGGQQVAESPYQAGQEPGKGAHAYDEQSKTEAQKTAADSTAKGQDLARSIDQAVEILSKSEKNLPPSKRKLLAAHKKSLEYFMRGWDNDLKDAEREILEVADHFNPKK